VSPRGRHEPGRHAEGRQPGDEPWARTSDHNVWRAYKNGLTLTVTRLAAGSWQAVIEGPGVDRRSPLLGSRGAAQAWADDRARGAS
jgi:hypothetical protein